MRFTQKPSDNEPFIRPKHNSSLSLTLTESFSHRYSEEDIFVGRPSCLNSPRDSAEQTKSSIHQAVASRKSQALNQNSTRSTLLSALREKERLSVLKGVTNFDPKTSKQPNVAKTQFNLNIASQKNNYSSHRKSMELYQRLISSQSQTERSFNVEETARSGYLPMKASLVEKFSIRSCDSVRNSVQASNFAPSDKLYLKIPSFFDQKKQKIKISAQPSLQANSFNHEELMTHETLRVLEEKINLSGPSIPSQQLKRKKTLSAKIIKETSQRTKSKFKFAGATFFPTKPSISLKRTFTSRTLIQSKNQTNLFAKPLCKSFVEEKEELEEGYFGDDSIEWPMKVKMELEEIPEDEKEYDPELTLINTSKLSPLKVKPNRENEVRIELEENSPDRPVSEQRTFSLSQNTFYEKIGRFFPRLRRK